MRYRKKSHWRKAERKVTWPFTSMRIDLTRERQLRSFCCSAGRSFAVLISGSMSRGYFVILVVTVRMHSGMPIFLSRGLLLHCCTNSWNLRSDFSCSL